MRFAIAVGVLFLIVNWDTYRPPLWTALDVLLVYIPMAYIGGLLACKTAVVPRSTDLQLADWIGFYTTRRNPVPPQPNTCPDCKSDIDASTAQEAGDWNGISASGTLTSGPIYTVACPACRTELRCSYNVWDGHGNLKPNDAPLELVWGKPNAEG